MPDLMHFEGVRCRVRHSPNFVYAEKDDPRYGMVSTRPAFSLSRMACRRRGKVRTSIATQTDKLSNKWKKPKDCPPHLWLQNIPAGQRKPIKRMIKESLELAMIELLPYFFRILPLRTEGTPENVPIPPIDSSEESEEEQIVDPHQEERVLTVWDPDYVDDISEMNRIHGDQGDVEDLSPEDREIYALNELEKRRAGVFGTAELSGDEFDEEMLMFAENLQETR